jgi:hypothetical protein
MHPGRAGAERRTRRVESEARVAENPARCGWRRRRYRAKGGRDFQVNAGALSRDAHLASALLSFAPVDHLRVRLSAAPAAPFMHFVHARAHFSLLYSLCLSLIVLFSL